MKVSVSSLIKREFANLDRLNTFIEQFSNWKTSSDEYNFYLFGKDSEFIFPKIVEGKFKHVHIMPLDNVELQKWDKKWKYKSRKTSNRFLIYAQNQIGDYLLIAILENGHNVIKMQNEKDKLLMSGYAKIADNFCSNGEII